jgi:hypothetical protein
MKILRGIKFESSKRRLISNYNISAIADIIPDEYNLEYKKLYEKYKDNKLKDNTTVYLTPLSIFPSYKLKNYIDENKLNISTARKSDKLDTVIVSDLFIRENFIDSKRDTFYIIPHKYINDNYNKFIYISSHYDNINEVPRYHLPKNYSKEITSFIITEKDLKEAILYDKSFEKLLQFPKITGHPISYFHGNKKAYDNIDFYLNLISLVKNYKLEVVFDNNVNSLANKDTVLDLEIFNTLYNMLASTDDSNWSIAREIIANCDFEVSKPYIMFLTNVFDVLKNKSNNKNYHLVYKQLVNLNDELERSMFWNSYADFINKMIKTYPEYKQVMCDCLTVHLNHLFKVDLVKTIHSL